MAMLVRQLLRPLADQGLAPLDGTVPRTGDAVAEPPGVSLAAHLGGLVGRCGRRARDGGAAPHVAGAHRPGSIFPRVILGFMIQVSEGGWDHDQTGQLRYRKLYEALTSSYENLSTRRSRHL